MKVHRFYLPLQLGDALQVKDPSLVHQWAKVLRIPVGKPVRIFNDMGIERQYRIAGYERDAASLEFDEEIMPKVPASDVTVCWSLLKKEKNEWVVQKCTEIGAKRFVPIIAERTEKTGFPLERMRAIVIEAAEQCGRADIPEIVEPLALTEALDEFGPAMELYACDEGGSNAAPHASHAVGFLIGPEGGWTEGERQGFSARGISTVTLGKFTFRAETAVIAAALLFSGETTRMA